MPSTPIVVLDGNCRDLQIMDFCFRNCYSRHHELRAAPMFLWPVVVDRARGSLC